MLAVVHHFAGAGMLIRRSPPAEVRPTLKQSHTKAAAGKGATGGKSRQSTSDDGYSGIL